MGTLFGPICPRAGRRIHIVDGKISETTLGGGARSEVAAQAGPRNVGRGQLPVGY
jgi:hypothetical protein